MKRFFLLFFVGVVSLSAQSVVAPTNEDLYKMLDSTFYWSEYGLPETAPLERAQALLLPGSESKSAKEKLSSFTLFLTLRNLFFYQLSQYESVEYAWDEMKSILQVRYGVNLGKLNLYSEVDWETLKNFAIQARKNPTVILPAIVSANYGKEHLPVVVRQSGENKISALVFRFKTYQEDIWMSAIPTDWNTDLSVSEVGDFLGRFKYSIGSIRFDGGYTSDKRWVQSVLEVPTKYYVGAYRITPVLLESGWSDNQGNDGYVWTPSVFWRIYQRGDLNLNFNLSLGDAIVGSNLLLSDSLPALPNLMDITRDGNSDQNDLLAIFQEVTRGWWGKGRVVPGVSQNSETLPSGKLIAEKFIRGGKPMVRIVFEGQNPGSSLALKISGASKAVFLGSPLKALSTSRENENILRVLRFEETPQTGILLEAEVQGDIKLEPLKNYFFALGENIEVVYRSSAVSGVDVQDNLPREYGLKQNYPNPFNPATIISFSLPNNSSVVLEVYNALGQLVNTLVKTELPAGEHSVSFDAHGLPSGVYLYRLQTPGFSTVKKMTLAK